MNLVKNACLTFNSLPTIHIYAEFCVGKIKVKTNGVQKFSFKPYVIITVSRKDLPCHKVSVGISHSCFAWWFFLCSHSSGCVREIWQLSQGKQHILNLGNKILYHLIHSLPHPNPNPSYSLTALILESLYRIFLGYRTFHQIFNLLLLLLSYYL